MGSTHGRQCVLTPTRKLLVEEAAKKEAERQEGNTRRGLCLGKLRSCLRSKQRWTRVRDEELKTCVLVN